MRLDGVGRRYGRNGGNNSGARSGPWGVWVLRGVDLTLREKSLVRVEGANGSGKSTLLRLIAGIDVPSAGRITGRPRCAYVPERFPAAMPMTVLDYLVRMGRIHGLGRGTARERAREWLERFGADAYARTPLSELSKGSSQKVVVSQALMVGAELLVLDEAWTGLEPAARTMLDRAVAALVTDGSTVVFVDHDPGRLAGAADATYRVEDGGVRDVTGQEPQRRGAPASGPRVRVEAEAPPGVVLPEGLPGSPQVRHTGEDTTVLTVPVAYSDALLRGLLAGYWHIRSVVREEQPR
ncbi:ATP-binding cassette domain-containing protein [Streptomyces sp. Amel2xB2]|uniref:ATP-binding cassette domain-containing protein n=1 Tax=Streptomyces sp. Amel2xB2 TaxID=1305829 RepID=UPI000DBA9590|nr:ATP-binding cassette domain-containing protein [Streptomyces sp. Amel2xB2]